MLLFLRSFIVLLLCLTSAIAGSHGHARTASSRAMYNIGNQGQFDYAFINMLQEGDEFLSPISGAFITGTCYWNTANLDSNGWPNNACANGSQFGGGVRFPSSTQVPGQYTIDGSGLTVMVLGIGAQFTLSSGVQCGGVASGTPPNNSGAGWGYSSATNGTITTNDTAGAGFCVPFTNVGQSVPLLTTFNFNNTCAVSAGACTGAFVKNVRLYQQADYARLAAGTIYRVGYLQPIATMDPSYIRFMDWGPGDGFGGQCRYENRPKLTTTGLITGSYWLSSPPYTVSAGTNLVSVAAVAGTPASMQHCEVATFRFGNTMNFGANFGPIIISAVSNATTGEVTTASPHGYSTGDVVIHYIRSAPTNMPNLNLYPVCITVIDTTHYTMQVFNIATNACTATNVNTTTWGAFSGVSGQDYVVEYVSLNVGSRVNAPITLGDGNSPIMTFWYALAGSFAVNLTYDKNSCGISDGAGNLICGAWLAVSTGLSNQAAGQGGNPPLAPVEVEVELVNEANALLTGGQTPIGLWITLPHMSLLPTDPDYTTASDYPLNTAKTIINGAYPLCSGCPVRVEDANEWWNNFYPTAAYFSRQNFLRYGIAGSTNFGTVRTVQMFEDIHNNSGVYNPSIFHFAMMGGPPGAVGDPRAPTSGNYDRIFGDTTIMSDARWPNPSSPPWAYFDEGGWAPYVEAPPAFYTANFATLEAAWCTAQSTACALTPPFAPSCTAGAIDTTYCLPFVNGITQHDPVFLLGLADILDADATFTQALSSVGKSFVDYEGGSNWATCATIDSPCGNDIMPDGTAITTAAQRNYLIAIYQSASWAKLWASYCQAKQNSTYTGGCGNLGELTRPAANFQFDLGSPDTFGPTTTEGSALIPLWSSLGTINAGQP